MNNEKNFVNVEDQTKKYCDLPEQEVLKMFDMMFQMTKEFIEKQQDLIDDRLEMSKDFIKFIEYFDTFKKCGGLGGFDISLEPETERFVESEQHMLNDMLQMSKEFIKSMEKFENLKKLLKE